MKVLEKGIMTTNIHIGFGNYRPIRLDEPYHTDGWPPRFPSEPEEDGFGEGDFDY